jgi:hypothetical protein
MGLNTLASQQATATEETAKSVVMILNYCATYPDAVLLYHKSDMILHVHSDASYLSEPEAKSRAGGHFFVSEKSNSYTTPPSQLPTNNGAVHTECTKIRTIMSSAAEAEVGSLFINSRAAVGLRSALQEMGHPQPPTPIMTDNSTASGIVNSSIKQRRSRAIDMRFYWVKDRVQQGQFFIFWKPGVVNLANYQTKHHPGSHHKNMRPNFLVNLVVEIIASRQAQADMQGCVETYGIHPTWAQYLEKANDVETSCSLIN